MKSATDNIKATEPAPHKKFGQHYLRNPNTLQRMLDEISPSTQECFIEIGPGSGALTLPLSKLITNQQGKLLAIEVDPRMVEVLDEKLADDPNILIIHSDALKDDLRSIIKKHQLNKARILGNLPYNISVHLIEKFLLLANFGIDPAGSKSSQPLEDFSITDMHFLVQKEIAQRLFAPVGDTNYGRLAIMIAVLGSGNKLFNVPPGDFSPPPKVTSSFIQLSSQLHPSFASAIDDTATSTTAAQQIKGYHKLQQLNQLVTAAFSRPNRKMSNTLKELPQGKLALEKTNLSNKRAKETSALEFISLLEHVMYKL